MSEFSLLMPFVVCQSKGGPYDDEAYVAGYEAGLVDARLDSGVDAFMADWLCHADNAPQLDLIAMRHGYKAEFRELGDGWMEARYLPEGKDE
jgi:hypothetical protein